MKYILPLLCCLVAQVSFGQVIEQISVGASYTDQTYYNVETGETVSVANDSWDLAFSVFGLQDAAVFVNEGAPSMGVELELYEVDVPTFETPLTPEDLTNRVYNDEISWAGGAFNATREQGNFADFGWGMYNPATMSVSGSKLFVLKLRDGSYKRIQIESLIGTSYNIKYADFDGSNVKTASVDKAEYSGRHLVYFSFADEAFKDLEPDNWHLLFTRYNSPVPDGKGEILNYVVTGALSAQGVKVAQADGVNPANVLFEDYEDSLSDQIDVIGFDWKQIDIVTFQWTLVPDRVYFVDIGSAVYKLFFFDFEGSGTGISTLEKTLIEGTSTEDLDVLNSFVSNVFPNPVQDQLQISIENNDGFNTANWSIYSLDGKKIKSSVFALSSGMQTIQINTDLSSGNYFMVLNLDDKTMVRKFIKD